MVQDVGIDAFAIGVLACAVGLGAWRRGGTAWKAGLGSLGLLGVNLVLLAEYNGYGGELGEGAPIHRALVYALYGLFALATLLLAPGLGRAGRRLRRFGFAVAGVWIVFAPLLFLVPTTWDGAYERLVGLVMLAWFAAVSGLLVRRGSTTSRSS